MFNNLRDRTVLVPVLVALVAGTLFGWLFFGWMLFPVTYKDTDPTSLRQDYKKTYVAMVADSYAIDQDTVLAERRLAGFSNAERSTLLAEVRADFRREGKDSQALRVQRLADALKVQIASSSSTAPTPASNTTTPSTASQLPLGLIAAAAALTLISLGVLGLFMVWSGRRTTGSEPEPEPLRERDRAAAAAPVADAHRVTSNAVAEAEPGAAALGHFVTTYKLGDDGYDTSFSIETPAGEFLGECGVGISEVVGEAPQRVTAFEVWLFDKSDIRTVTKVLMSEHAYSNDTIRKKLQARGDFVMAEQGGELLLETEALLVRAIIADMAYTTGGTPQSVFSRLTMELAPSIKDKSKVAV